MGYGFQAGAVRAWLTPEAVRVRVELFRLAEAAEFADSEQRDLAGRYPPGAVGVVPQVGAGRSYTWVADGMGFTLVVFCRGDVVVELRYGHPGAPDRDEAVRQALAQYERL
jgi:hypothetical protein